MAKQEPVLESKLFDIQSLSSSRLQPVMKMPYQFNDEKIMKALQRIDKLEVKALQMN